MFTAFSTALSALDANSVAVDAVGNDLANLNSSGYKSTEVAFSDMISESLGGINSFQLGMGTSRPQTIREFKQGTMQTGAGQLDAAIQGQGFFVVNDSTGNPLYTRDGTFTVDTDGYLVDAQGQKVQGWTASDGVLNTSGATGNILVPSGTLLQPTATKNVSLTMNLDSSATVGSTAGTFSQPLTVYDSLGNSHTLTVTFSKSAENTWNYAVTVPGEDLASGTSGTPSQVASGTLTFDSNGNLLTPPSNSGTVALPVTGLADGAADLNINWNLYGSSSTPLVTQVDQTSAVAANSQDGNAASQLSEVIMGNGGQLMAQYSDGEQIAVGQLAVAQIRNPNSMTAIGGNDFRASSVTATPVVGTAGTGGRGDIVGEALEQSTVDISQEFTNLLSLQEAYQANSRVITSENTLLQATVNLIQE
jgi:flagellar hook protein FlgE